ncbi:unnamed protein product [Camellia sinensis]
MGFCWGAKVVVERSKSDYLQAAVLLHPSLVTVDDIKELKVPIAILGAEIDKISPPELLKQFEEGLSSKRTKWMMKKLRSKASYMAATESAKAKLRAQGSPRLGQDGAENGLARRQSLPSSTNGKVISLSPRVQRPAGQANGTGGSRSDRSLLSSREEKVIQPGKEGEREKANWRSGLRVRLLLRRTAKFAQARGKRVGRCRKVKVCVEVRRAAKARLPPAGEAELLDSKPALIP